MIDERFLSVNVATIHPHVCSYSRTSPYPRARASIPRPLRSVARRRRWRRTRRLRDSPPSRPPSTATDVSNPPRRRHRGSPRAPGHEHRVIHHLRPRRRRRRVSLHRRRRARTARPLGGDSRERRLVRSVPRVVPGLRRLFARGSSRVSHVPRANDAVHPRGENGVFEPTGVVPERARPLDEIDGSSAVRVVDFRHQRATRASVHHAHRAVDAAAREDRDVGVSFAEIFPPSNASHHADVRAVDAPFDDVPARAAPDPPQRDTHADASFDPVNTRAAPSRLEGPRATCAENIPPACRSSARAISAGRPVATPATLTSQSDTAPSIPPAEKTAGGAETERTPSTPRLVRDSSANCTCEHHPRCAAQDISGAETRGFRGLASLSRPSSSSSASLSRPSSSSSSSSSPAAKMETRPPSPPPTRSAPSRVASRL